MKWQRFWKKYAKRPLKLKKKKFLKKYWKKEISQVLELSAIKYNSWKLSANLDKNICFYISETDLGMVRMFNSESLHMNIINLPEFTMFPLKNSNWFDLNPTLFNLKIIVVALIITKCSQASCHGKCNCLNPLYPRRHSWPLNEKTIPQPRFAFPKE